MSLEKVYTTIYEHPPKPEDAQRFNKIAEELTLRSNDAIWPVVFYLGHHLELYRGIPEAISKTAEETLKSFQLAAVGEIEAAKAKTQAALTQAVAAAAHDVATATARKQQWQWMAVGLAVAALGACLAGWFGFQKGNESGYNRGLNEANDVKAASLWVNTDDGKAAFRLWKSGDLRHLANCDFPGWKLGPPEDGTSKACFVHPASDGVTYGWHTGLDPQGKKKN